MSEENEKPESPDAEKLQSLFGDFDLTPDWAKGSPGVKQTDADKRGRRGGARSGGGGPRAPKSDRRSMQGVRVKPRRDPGGSGGGGDRGPYPPRDGAFDDRRGGGRGRPERAPRVPVHVDFIPDKKRLSKVVKVIRASHRAYPLHVVAEKFMENPAFISMKYTVKDRPKDQPEGEDFFLYVCTANGMVFSDAQACETYILEHGIEAYYDSESQEVPPPAGNFICVGRHSRSKRLIGPPNWHGYQARLEELRAEIAPGIPPEVFASQVEMVHEPEAIGEWKKEVSTQTFYRRKLSREKKPGKPEKEAAPEKEEKEEKQEAISAVEPESSETSDPVDPVAPSDANVPAESPETAEVQEAEVQEAEVQEAEAAPEEAPVADERPFDLTKEQAEAEFKREVLPRLIRKTKRSIMPGYLLDKMTDPGLLALTTYHLNREHQRPNSIIFALRPAFKHMRLHVFRHKGEIMVSGVEQHPLPEDMKVVAEIRSLLDYVADHPGCNTQEALKTVSNAGEEIPAEMVSHFRWLIEKGHLVEFHDDTLELPARRNKS